MSEIIIKGRPLNGNAWSTVKDSGRREEFPTGSLRDSEDGKGRFDLLPFHGLKRLAVHFENGAKKYGDNNWQKGQPMRRFLRSGIRHAFQYLAGFKDEDHLAAACWNFMAALDTEERISIGELPPELNDVQR